LLWEAYKGRLGSNEFSETHFDLNALLQLVGDLDDLIAPFSPEEIDNVIKDLKMTNLLVLMGLIYIS
jgi:hypothetical protein